MYKAKHAVLFDEFRATTGAVLLKSNSQVVGDADVQRSVSAVCENVDVTGVGLLHSGKNFGTVVMGPGVRRDDEYWPLEQIKNTLASL